MVRAPRPALAAKLHEEEAQLSRLKGDRTASARETPARVLPHPTAVAGYLKNLFAVLDGDPVRGRELLARFRPRELSGFQGSG